MIRAVFLHGMFGHPGDWDAVVQGLDETVQGLDAIRPPLPGHHPDHPMSQGLSLAEAAGKLWAGLPWAEVVHLVGYSLGGRMAMAMARACPDRVRSLTLVAASPGLADPEDRNARARVDRERAERLRTGGLAGFLAAWYRLPLFRYPGGTPPQVMEIRARRAGHDVEQMARAMEAWSPGLGTSAWDLLPQWAGRGLYLAGEFDTDYTRLLPSYREAGWVADTVAEAAHDVHLAQPADLARRIALFWSSVGDRD